MKPCAESYLELYQQGFLLTWCGKQQQQQQQKTKKKKKQKKKTHTKKKTKKKNKKKKNSFSLSLEVGGENSEVEGHVLWRFTK